MEKHAELSENHNESTGASRHRAHTHTQNLPLEPRFHLREEFVLLGWRVRATKLASHPQSFASKCCDAKADVKQMLIC